MHATARAFPGVGRRRHLLESHRIFWSGLFPASMASASFLSLIFRDWQTMVSGSNLSCHLRAKNVLYFFKWLWDGEGSKRRITACKMWKLHEIKITMSINKILLEPSHARLFTWCPWSWDRGCMPQTQSEKSFLSGPLWGKFVNPWTRRALRKGFEIYSQ